MGSPPLARGTVILVSNKSLWKGITPACAGNSLTERPTYSELKDHPRLRGEQYLVRWVLQVVLGSPPLARGTVSRRYRSRRNGGDHPRLRGEQCTAVHLFSFPRGSPPLARGTGGLRVCDIKDGRITPACAGNSILSQIR